MRDALGRHLHLIDTAEALVTDRDRARATGAVQPARVGYRKVTPQLRLPKGTTSLDLLGRDDRF